MIRFLGLCNIPLLLLIIMMSYAPAARVFTQPLCIIKHRGGRTRTSTLVLLVSLDVNIWQVLLIMRAIFGIILKRAKNSNATVQAASNVASAGRSSSVTPNQSIVCVMSDFLATSWAANMEVKMAFSGLTSYWVTSGTSTMARQRPINAWESCSQRPSTINLKPDQALKARQVKSVMHRDVAWIGVAVWSISKRARDRLRRETRKESYTMDTLIFCRLVSFEPSLQMFIRRLFCR